MTDKKNDGGFAFPLSVEPSFQFDTPGMTIRQWYKGMALQGLAQGMSNQRRCAIEDGNPYSADKEARLAGDLADAMIKEDEQ